MRMKQIWDFVPLPAKMRLVWNRITFSRLTTAYFTFSVLHFIIQLAFQIHAFTINAEAARFLNSIIVQNNATSSDVPVLGNDLRMCVSLPLNLSTSACPIVWPKNSSDLDSSNDQPDVAYNMMASSVPVITSVSFQAAAPSVETSTDQLDQQLRSSTVRSTKPTVTVTLFASPTAAPAAPLQGNTEGDNHSYNRKLFIRHKFAAKGPLELVPHDELATCLEALNWPVATLDNTKREDIVFVAFQFWVLGMSFVALLNESIPHIIASLLTHILATSWAAFQITNTSLFRVNFTRLITKGACQPAVLLPTYWEDRGRAEIPILAFNILALFISCFLTWRLIKLFGWQTFKRVGASLAINRIYKLVLTLSITIQLSLFFMVVTVAIWIDQLFNGAIARKATLREFYQITFTATLILLVPWLMTGWCAVRREWKVPMIIFLALSVGYLGGWGAMFLSATFRWTFIQWRFFSVMASASVLLTLMSLVLGVICLLNFGRGLPRYLNAQELLPGDDFIPVTQGSGDVEKVAFPSTEKPVPTFSATFGSGSEVPLPTQMFASRMGPPRFFDSQNDSSRFHTDVPTPAPALTRSGSDKSKNAPLMRRGSERSIESSSTFLSSYYNSSSDGDDFRSDGRSRSPGGRGQRWVIE